MLQLLLPPLICVFVRERYTEREIKKGTRELGIVYCLSEGVIWGGGNSRALSAEPLHVKRKYTAIESVMGSL